MKPKYTIPTQLSRQRERFGVEHNSAYWFAVDKYRGLIVACCRHVAKAHCSHETDGTKAFSWEHEKKLRFSQNSIRTYQIAEDTRCFVWL